ncbi:NF038120 family PEP-CTERM protein [Ideonella sp. A 288]|uniref:NF038120 family PEP-CTERM protein n=1 Tax=Ideonella sp. A 288 TaxID=1962181 RepID=UPI001303A3B9|nr:NF038120 family PEP-CTERM protein [Ideonella sp. A 288]
MAATAVPTIASAALVDFESAPPLTVVGPGQPDASYTESGVTFTPTGSDAIVDLSSCAPALGESCIRNNFLSVYLTALNGAEVTITTQRAFSIDALDASFFPLPTPAGIFANSPMGLKLVGTLWDGGLIETTLSLLEAPGVPGDFVFSSYGLPGSPLLRSMTLGACVFIGADCVRSGVDFDAAGYLFNDLQFAIDNLSLTIPEPSALWLVALSLGGLAFTRRRSAR